LGVRVLSAVETRATKSLRVMLGRRACALTWRCKSSPNVMEVKGSEPQGRHREVGSEGSGEQEAARLSPIKWCLPPVRIPRVSDVSVALVRDA